MTQDLPTASTLSHYRILSKLGAGGMGEVYLAQDTKLDRKVALKVLPADVASNRDRMERFIREAKSSAALNHPNIAHVYEIGEAEVRGSTSPEKEGSGYETTPEVVHYIAMEFIDGVTLREKIHQEQTSLPKLLRYLIQVAEGLNKAHAAGIVHRDLKPDNIMITRDDYAKVLDFGLAKLIETPFGIGGTGRSGTEDPTMALSHNLPVTPSLSTPGIVLGTIGYMSPEQASGRVYEIDHRSDIFSFGCILFEAATRRKAFAGKDALDSLHKIVHAPTPVLKEVNPLAPDDLQRVVRRCLAKEAEKRYQSMKEVAIEIDELCQELKSYNESHHTAPSNAPLSSSKTSQPAPIESRSGEGFWVAVLPFKCTGSNADVTVLSEGLSEDIVTGLSRFSYLHVIARSSTLQYKNELVDIRTVGQELGARYVMEGGLRQAGSILRISVQLVDTNTGAHLWAESYDRRFPSADIFALQDELVSRIVSTAADRHGVLPRTMSEGLRNRVIDDLNPYEVLVRGYGYFERISSSEHALLRTALERVVEESPSSDIWAMLAIIYCDEHRFGFNPLPGSLDRALAAAQRAVEASVSNSFANEALAQALFFRKEFESFRNTAERAISLNPLDGATTAFMGLLIAHAGDWDRGCEIAERAMQFNPHHPGWYWTPAFWKAYQKHDYLAALSIAHKINMRSLFYYHVNLAMVYGQLGEFEAANKAVSDLLDLKPDFVVSARKELGKWLSPELVEHAVEGLRKAGLEIGEEGVKTSTPSNVYSSETRSGEGFWVAVLPFKSSGSNLEIKTLSEGLSEEIVTGLSRFPYLRVIDTASTTSSGRDNSDPRFVGRALGARYVLEGSLRQAGSTLRVAVKLVDTTSGAHLWAETYDRTFNPDSVFELQDELVPRIVSTVADQYGALVHSMSESLRHKKVGECSPHEAVLRTFGYSERITEEEHAEVREILEAAIADSPDHSGCLAMLASIYYDEYAQGYNPRPNPLERAYATAQLAVEAAPTNNIGHYVLALVLFFKKDFLAFRLTAERAIALNRMDASTTAYLAILLAYSGEWDRGLTIVRRAMELNPHHPGWYHFPIVYSHYRQRDYRGALENALKVNMPGYVWFHVALAAIYGQLGDQERARASLRDLNEVMPDFGQIARQQCSRWFDDELMQHVLEGLRKAGLEIANERGVSTSSRATSTGAGSSLSIAVLPFKNLSPDPDNEFFADGLTEEVIADLSGICALRVISRTSVMHFKESNKSLRAIARELDVRYVLEGSVRRSGDSLRITAQLIDAENDSNLWTEKYSGSIEDVFAIQEEISRKIVNALQLRLTDSEARGIAERPIDKAAAYDCYMRARHEVNRFTAEGLDRAQKLVDAGLSMIGENPLLLATRGMVSWYYLNFSIRPEKRYLNEAEDYALRSLEQDPQNYLGIFLRGLVAAKRGEVEVALRDIQAAHEQKPGDAMILNELIRHHCSAGLEQSESARAALEESLRVDPLHPLNWAQASWRHFNAGRLAEAVEAARRILHLTDRGNPARVYAGYYLALSNEIDEAIAVFEAEGATLQDNAYGSLGLFLSRALRGDAAGAVKHVTEKLEKSASWTEYVALLLADGYALIGDKEAALHWLKTSVDQGFINYPYLAICDPFLANVRTDPRFTEFVQGVKARWEVLAENFQVPLESSVVPNNTEVHDTSRGSGQVAPAHSGSFDSWSSPVKTIAVLPLHNLSGEPEQEFFADGITEEILNALAQIPGLRVAGRSSSFSFKGRNEDLRSIGAKLNVGSILEGTLRRSGDRLRITAQLIDTNTGYQLWSERYDRVIEDVFTVQDEIASTIAGRLQLSLDQQPASEQPPTKNIEAYELYLKGRALLYQRGLSIAKAIDCFSRAVSIDPSYAQAWAGLADGYTTSGYSGFQKAHDVMPRALEAARRSLELDENLAEAHNALACATLLYERNYELARVEFKEALRFNPNYPQARAWYGLFYLQWVAGREEEAREELSRLLQIDPLSGYANVIFSFYGSSSGRSSEAVEHARRGVELDPNSYLAQWSLAVGLEADRQFEEAAAVADRALAMSGRHSWALATLGSIYEGWKKPAQAKAIYGELRARAEREYVQPGMLAVAAAAGENFDEAIVYAREAVEVRDPLFVMIARTWPQYSSLRALPEFLEIVGQLNLPNWSGS